MMLAADRKRHCGFKRNASAFEEPLFFSVSRIEAREDEDDHPFTTLHRPTVQYGTSPYKKWLASLPHMSSKQLVDLVKKMQPDEPMVGREKGELVAMLSSTPMNEACNALQMTKPMELDESVTSFDILGICQQQTSMIPMRADNWLGHLLWGAKRARLTLGKTSVLLESNIDYDTVCNAIHELMDTIEERPVAWHPSWGEQDILELKGAIDPLVDPRSAEYDPSIGS